MQTKDILKPSRHPWDATKGFKHKKHTKGTKAYAKTVKHK